MKSADKFAKKRAVRTPKGRRVLLLRPKLAGKHYCALCERYLIGTRKASVVQLSSLGKNSPNRPFGGILCSSCSRKVSLYKGLLLQRAIKPAQVPIGLRKFIGVKV